MGKWVRAWDAANERWMDIYLEEPPSNYRGTGYVLYRAPDDQPALLGPDGKPLTTPPNPRRGIGFRP
jgi:hypothetical protein